MLSKTPILLSMTAAIALVGCGKAPAEDAKKAPAAKGIFVSVSDCAASKKMTKEQCGKAIDYAVRFHRKLGKTYKSLQQCERTEGEGYCDKGGDGSYQPRILAFLVTMSDPPEAEALYVSTDAAVTGFRATAAGPVNAIDDTITVSSTALGVANDNAATLKK